jgi:hypothetical protein
MIAMAKADTISAAVVFLPENTQSYGAHSYAGDSNSPPPPSMEESIDLADAAGGGSRLTEDQHNGSLCLCHQLYGEKKPWGCSWFALWCDHIKKAVSLNQRLQIFYQAGYVGKGKATSWELCAEESLRRDSLFARRQKFLRDVPEREKQLLADLSGTARDDSRGENPGSDRGDLEEKLFDASLSEADRAFLEAHKGLGNSQKAEVAWLEKMGFEYEERDVRHAVFGRLSA